MENKLARAGGRVDVLLQALKAVALASKPVMVSIKCLRDRPNRSKRQTTRVSPALRWLRAS